MSLEIITGTTPFPIIVNDGMVVIFAFDMSFKTTELDAVAFFRIALSLLDLTD